MTDETSDDNKRNVFQMISGNKGENVVEDTVPENEYVIVDRENNEYFATGFLVFTSQHIAVMEDTSKGALPIFVMPLDRVHVVELND